VSVQVVNVTDRWTDGIGKTISHSACYACWRAIIKSRNSTIAMSTRVSWRRSHRNSLYERYSQA